MADALAISAAVVQFVDIALRLSIKLNWLCSELRDAPQWLCNLKNDVDDQIFMARLVQSSHVSASSSLSPSTGSALPIERSLNDYLQTMDRLHAMIESVTNDPDTGGLLRSWNSLRAVHKRKEILGLCESLERKKSIISLWLCNASVNLSSEINKNIQQMQPRIDKILDLSSEEERTASRAAAQLNYIASLVQSVNYTSSNMALLANDNASNQEKVLRLVEHTSQAVDTLLYRCHSLRSEPATSHKNLALEEGKDFHDDLETGVSILKDEDADQAVISTQRATKAPRNRIPSFEPVCTCRAFNQTTQTQPIPGLQFRHVLQRRHYKKCPKSKTAENSRELMMRVLIPSWILCSIVKFSIVFNWSPNTSWRISPIIIGASRIVNATESPAFRAVHQTKRILLSGGFKTSGTHLKALENTLKDLFQGYKASALDEDCLGNTLLYEVIELLIRHESCGVSSYAGHAGPEYLSLIRYLLQSGANPNVIQSTGSSNIWRRDGGTALDAFACDLTPTGYEHIPSTDVGNEIYEYLVDNDGEFSKPLESLEEKVSPGYYFQFFKVEMLRFMNFPEQIELCALGELSTAIIQRSEKDLKRAMTKGNLDYASPVNGLTAMHFAITWLLALQELISAGADVNCEDAHGRRPVHLAVGCGQGEAVEMLLKADCAICTPNYSNSLLQESLCRGRDFDHITDLVIDALIDRHTRLVKLALSVLPDSSGLVHRLVEGNLCESLIPSISEAFDVQNHTIPAALQLNSDGEGVYDTAHLHAIIRLTVPLAEKLWQGGFRNVNEPSCFSGLTPILQSWYNADFEMVAWFISKGAFPFGKHPLVPISGLHLYAARVAYPGAHFRHDASAVNTSPELMAQLMRSETHRRDSCDCLCSRSGCGALSTLIKHAFMFIVRKSSFQYEKILLISKIWQEKMLYLPEQEPDHVEQFLRSFIFDYLGMQHTCCEIGQNGQPEMFDIDRSKNRVQNISQYLTSRETLSDAQLELKLEEVVDDCLRRMPDCRCPLPEKPVCVLFRKSCNTV